MACTHQVPVVDIFAKLKAASQRRGLTTLIAAITASLVMSATFRPEGSIVWVLRGLQMSDANGR